MQLVIGAMALAIVLAFVGSGCGSNGGDEPSPSPSSSGSPTPLTIPEPCGITVPVGTDRIRITFENGGTGRVRVVRDDGEETWIEWTPGMSTIALDPGHSYVVTPYKDASGNGFPEADCGNAISTPGVVTYTFTDGDARIIIVLEDDDLMPDTMRSSIFWPADNVSRFLSVSFTGGGMRRVEVESNGVVTVIPSSVGDTTLPLARKISHRITAYRGEGNTDFVAPTDSTSVGDTMRWTFKDGKADTRVSVYVNRSPAKALGSGRGSASRPGTLRRE
jgi:uncharacterized protein (DUF1684 family)